jgi:hypothetical protein
VTRPTGQKRSIRGNRVAGLGSVASASRVAERPGDARVEPHKRDWHAASAEPELPSGPAERTPCRAPALPGLAACPSRSGRFRDGSRRGAARPRGGGRRRSPGLSDGQPIRPGLGRRLCQRGGWRSASRGLPRRRRRTGGAGARSGWQGSWPWRRLPRPRCFCPGPRANGTPAGGGRISPSTCFSPRPQAPCLLGRSNRSGKVLAKSLAHFETCDTGRPHATRGPLSWRPPRNLLVPNPPLGLPLPVKSAPAEDVVDVLELAAEELAAAWHELVARTVLEHTNRN